MVRLVSINESSLAPSQQLSMLLAIRVCVKTIPRNMNSRKAAKHAKNTVTSFSKTRSAFLYGLCCLA